MSGPSSFLGRFVWRELLTDDLAEAKAFYGPLFEWTFDPFQSGGRRCERIRHDELDFGAIAPLIPELGKSAWWVGYIGVADVERACEEIEEAGGKVEMSPRSLPGLGTMALAADPAGATFAPFEPETPTGRDYDARPPDCTFCWSQLMVPEPEDVIAFYGRVFDWVAEPMLGPRKAYVFKRGEAMVGSAMTSPKEAEGQALWMSYVSVLDVDLSYGRALELGAGSFKPPTDIPGLGRFAVIGDPQGAIIALWKHAD